MDDLLVSLIRTIVPATVGWLAGVVSYEECQ